MDQLFPIKSATRQQLYRLLPLFVILLATFLRFHLLDHQSLWNDEGNTLRLVQRIIPDLLQNAARDIHPPGYYLLLKGWWLLTGETEFALRALSAFAGVLTVACVYSLGRALFSQGAGLAASLFVAINAFNVYYSQEARMYALLACIAAASMTLFVRWTARPIWRYAIALAILNAVGLYTQYVYPFVMVVQGILFVLLWLYKRDPRLLGQYISLNLLTLIFFAPQAATAYVQITGWPRTGQAIDAGTGLSTIARWLIYGNTAGDLTWAAYIWPAMFIAVALLPDWKRHPQPSWWRRILPCLWLIVAIVPLFGLGLFREANLKFLLPAQIAASLLIGRGVWLLWEIGSSSIASLLEALPRLLALAGLLSMLSYANQSLTNLYENSTYARSNYRAVTAHINADPRSGDAIILDAPNQWEVFTYYYQGNATIYPLPEGLGGDDTKTIDQVSEVIDQHRRIFVLYWGEVERDPNRVVEKTLTERAFEATSAWYGDVRFVQYATLPQSSGPTITPNAKFGDLIALESATLSASELKPGDVLGITLQWSTSAAIATRYKVFVQLLNDNGELIAQHDAEPGNNMAITTTWEPGQSVTDSHGLLLPVSLIDGNYTVIVGLYDMNNPQDRLKTGSSGDYLELAIIRVSR